MKPELERFARETREGMRRAEALYAEQGDAACGHRVSAKVWSVADCLEHLTLTARAYLPLLKEFVKSGASRGGGSYQPSWIWRWFVWSLEPPVRLRVPTPEKFLPPPQLTPRAALEEFLAVHEELLALLPELDELDLGAVKIRSPFGEWMQYPVGLVFCILPAHMRRHLWQADQLFAGSSRKAGVKG